MRRSICYTEPTFAQAGETSTWKFSYTTATALPKGTKLKFDLLTKGRSMDWQAPSCDPKAKDNLIVLSIEGRSVFPKEVESEDSFISSYEFTLPLELKAGDTLDIFVGCPKDPTKKDKGNRAQTYVQRRRPFYLYIDTKGKGDYKEPEIFTLDIKGGPLDNIRILSPSIVSRNQRFDVIVRFEDAFGNLTSNAKEGTLIELSYEHLRENLSWKLFVPETGFINLPNLYFNEPGIYRIQLKNLSTNEKFFSYPIKCLQETERNLFWGLLHGESDKIDCAENVESCLRHFRDEKALHFYGVSPFESVEETPSDIWKSITHQVAEFDEPGRFVAFLGFQWIGDEGENYLRHIVYGKDSKPILRKKDAKTNNLKKVYKSSHVREFISIPCFTMAKGIENELESYTPEFERVVEIYNAWGSSECSAKEGNLRPIKNKGKKGFQSGNKGSILEALNAGHRFGFIAGGWDDRGIYSQLYEDDQVQYSPGLSAVFAEEQTRESLFQALYNRHCYATTGHRIILGFSIAGFIMGSELSTKAKPGLAYNRHITGYAASNNTIDTIEIIRNGKVFKKYQPKSNTFEFTLDDGDLLSDILLFSTQENLPFVYYYLRVIQEDGNIAWGSPIWIDYMQDKGAASSGKKSVTKKSK